jgi:hypothetical protein
MRRTPAASRKVRLIQWRKRLKGDGWNEAPGERLRRGGKPRRSPVTRGLRKERRLRKEKRRHLEAIRSSPLLALSDRVKLPNIFVPENERTFVHLAQAIQEDRNIDVLIFILVFEWLEPAVKKGVFYAVNQIGNYTVQSKSKSLFVFLREFKAKSNNLSYFVNFTFSKIFINETVSDAVNRLRIDANNFLTNKPIAHVIPHHRSGYTLGEDSFVSGLKYKPQT